MISILEIAEIEYVKNAFAVVGFLVVAGYVTMRILQKSFQRKQGITNIEFWVFFALKDMYKDYGYPDEEKYALRMLKDIRTSVIKDTTLIRKKPLGGLGKN